MQLRYISVMASLMVAFATMTVSAKTVKEEIAETPMKAGGIYYLYDFDTMPSETPVPDGYEPFYISHYGRHGSRWIEKDTEYNYSKKTMDEAAAAGVLTEEGKRVKALVDSIYADSYMRIGELTQLGAQQHQRLAHRMMKRFPKLFSGNAKVSAESTNVLRCVMSMAAFCEGLKEINPDLKIVRDAGMRTTSYLCFHRPECGAKMTPEIIEWQKHGEFRKAIKEIDKQVLNPERLMKVLFTKPDFLDKASAQKLELSLYYLAVAQPSAETDFNLMPYFTLDELYEGYVSQVYRHYTYRGPWPGNNNIPLNIGTVLVEDFVNRADHAIASGDRAADLRFGHDVVIMEFTALIELPMIKAGMTDPYEIAENYRLYDLTPMAANMQWVYYRKPGSDDVLVKMLYNDREEAFPVKTDCYPYYHWNDVRKFLIDKVNTINAAEAAEKAQKESRKPRKNK